MPSASPGIDTSPAPSETSPLERQERDNAERLHNKPATPRAHTLTTSVQQLADGTFYALVTVSYTPVRKDIDYLIRWRHTGETNYTYERIRTFPHVIKPVKTNTLVGVGLTAEFRGTGSRSVFNTDVLITSATDTVPPAAPTGFSVTATRSGRGIQLIWTPSPEPDFHHYQINRSGSLLASGGITSSYLDTSGVGGTTYTYQVFAFDRTGNVSAGSPALNAIFPFFGALTAPGEVLTSYDPGGSDVIATTTSQTYNIGSINGTVTWTVVVSRNGAQVGNPTPQLYLKTGGGQSTAQASMGPDGGTFTLVISTITSLAPALEVHFWDTASANTTKFTVTISNTVVT